MKKYSFKFHWSFFLLGLVMIYFGQGLLYFCCTITVILHEFGHAFVGKNKGYKLNTISLMPYGASLSGNNAPFKPKDEISIALAGPCVNVLIILFLTSLWWFFPSTYSFTQDFYSANISTILYNLLPIFPLDGGRVLLGLLSTKLPRKKAFKLTKIIGFVATSVLFVFFFLSFFSQLNYSIGINALFLLIGLFDDDKTAYYINLQDLDAKNEKLAKGLFLKTIAISENSTIYDAYKVLDKNNVNQIYIMDENFHVKQNISENDLEKLIFTLPLDTKLKNIKNREEYN